MSRATRSPAPPHTARVALLALAAALAAACSHSRADVASEPSGGETVDLGYGTADRRDVTTSVSSLDEDEVSRANFNHVEEILQGRVAGLQVTRLPSGEFSVRIRGTRSFSGSSEPLVVVDGIPAMSVTQGIAGVMPSDVKRVDVLKGAAAAMYGSRGANGVILIATKRGK